MQTALSLAAKEACPNFGYALDATLLPSTADFATPIYQDHMVGFLCLNLYPQRPTDP